MKMNRTMVGILTLALLSVSCSKQQDEARGRLSFSVVPDGQVTEVTRSLVSDYTTLPQIGKFTIVVTGNNGNEVYNGLLEAYDESENLLTGNYTVKASYGSTSDRALTSLASPERRHSPSPAEGRPMSPSLSLWPTRLSGWATPTTSRPTTRTTPSS